jgi:excisionase family DNA binding protein
MPNADQPLTYTVEEVARLLRIGRNQGYDAARAGELPTIRIGKRILVPRLALEQMLARALQPEPKATPARHPRGRREIAA